MLKNVLLTDVFNLYNRGERLQVDALRKLPLRLGLLSLFGFMDAEYCEHHKIEVVGWHRPLPLPLFFLIFFMQYLRAWLYYVSGVKGFLSPLLRKVVKYEFAVDLGGETFTTYAKWWYAYKHIFTLHILKLLQVPYGVMSQTILLKEGVTRSLGRHVLTHAEFITTRDLPSYRLMKSFHLQHVHLFLDVAFSVSPFIVLPERNSLRIGVNLSPFVASNLGSYIVLVVKLVNQGYEVVLIPHVIYNAKRDDRKVLWSLYQALPLWCKSHVGVLLLDDFEYIQGMIHSCNVMISSRMHLAIYSLSIGIPTILLGYSHKSRYLQEQIGDHLFLVAKDDPELPHKIVEHIHMIKKHYDSFVDQLRKDIKKIKEESYGHITMLLQSV